MADQKLTAAQRCKIFALGNEQGKGIDDLRAMTPVGSISMLTRMQAAQLIDALEHGKSPDYEKRSRVPASRRPGYRRPKNVIRMVTDQQRNMIEALRIDFDWTKDGLDKWLSARHYPGEQRPLTQMQTSKDAQFVIELLKEVLNRSMKGRQRSAAGQSTTASA